jgi:hypothetical protein
MFQNCCCEEQTSVYRKCLFDYVLVHELPLSEPCEEICDKKVVVEEESKEDGISVFLSGFLVAIVLFAAGVGFFLLRCRRKKKKTIATIITTTKGDDIERTMTPRTEPADFKSSASCSPSVDASCLTDDFNRKPTKAVFIPHRSRHSSIKQEDCNTERSVDQKRRSSETSKRSKTAPLGLEAPNDLEAALFDDATSRGESAMVSDSPRMYSLSEVAECHMSAPATIFDESRQSSQQEAYSVSINEDQESLCSKLSELQQTKDDLEARMTQYKDELKSTSREQQSSSRRLREVLKLKRDTTQRLRELESTMGLYEGRLKAAEDEARVLRRGSINDAVRIIQLECQNAELSEQLQRSSSLHNNDEAHSIL